MGRYTDKAVFKSKEYFFPFKFKKFQKTRKHIISIEEDKRPDIIAINEYGDPNLYYILMIANGKYSFNDFKVSETIEIPLL